MKIEFIEAKWKGRLRLDKSALEILPRRVGLCASVQFLEQLNGLKRIIEGSGRIAGLLHAGGRAGEVLGCSKIKVRNWDAILFVGDGKFHPENLGRQFKGRVYQLDPFSGNLSEVKVTESINLRQRGAYARMLSERDVGVIISLKPGQQWRGFNKLERAFPRKRFYYLLFDEINLIRLRDFPFRVFINTACPRIGEEDAEEAGLAVVNIGFLSQIHPGLL